MQPHPTRQESLAATLDAHGMWPDPGGLAVVACSGGADSTVLARLLVPLLRDRGVRATLACLDHGWRGDQGAADAASVETLAAALDASFVATRRLAAPELIAEVGREAAARQVRRRWLASLVDCEADRIYLGHQRDDQLETVLLRREQGVPLGRAATMAWRDGPWCRPLLDVSRGALRRLAVEAGWRWREDPTNEDLRFERSRIRQRVVPELLARDPGAAGRLLREGEEARERIDAALREADQRLSEVVLARDADSCVLSRSGLASSPIEVGILLLRQLCAPCVEGGRRPGRTVLLAVLRDCTPRQPARLRQLGAGWTARVAGDRVELARHPLRLEGDKPGPRTLCEGQEVDWPGGWRIGARRTDAAEVRRRLADPAAGRTFAIFDPANLRRPLSVRAAGRGLHLRPFGLAGTAKVRDLLAEAGVPRPQRAAWPTLVDADGQVLWLPGIRASEVAPVANSGAAIILYTVAGPSPEGAPAPTPGTP